MKNAETGADEPREIDVVISTEGAETPGERTVLALGETEVCERLTSRHVRRLKEARDVMGTRVGGDKLLLFGHTFDDTVRVAAAEREDLELVDLERLYEGS